MPRAPRPIPIALNYAAGNFGAQPHTVSVLAGDTLVFTRGSGTAADHKIRVTIAKAQNFSSGQVAHTESQRGDEPLQISVSSNLLAGTTYRCELLDRNLHPVLDGNGKPIAADGTSGGNIDPETGN